MEEAKAGPSEAAELGMISLMVKYNHETANLSTLILQLQVWEWERCLNKTHVLDTAKFMEGAWNENGRLRFADIFDSFKTYVNPEERENDLVIWSRQVKKYTTTITLPQKEAYYPQLLESFLFWIGLQVPGIMKEMRGVGRWNRCYRIDGLILGKCIRWMKILVNVITVQQLQTSFGQSLLEDCSRVSQQTRMSLVHRLRRWVNLNHDLKI